MNSNKILNTNFKIVFFLLLAFFKMIPNSTEESKLNEDITEENDTFQLIGLKNQGATCYLNCVLQTLFHLPYFRLRIFKCNLEDILNEKTKSIFLQFQTLFTLMQTSQNSAIATKSLTKAFGWKDSYTKKQQDAHSFFLWLISDILSPVFQDVISELFEGKIRTLIHDKISNYVKVVDEVFYELSMNVKNCKSLEESFSKYIEAEDLVGDNQYISSPSRGNSNATIQNTFVKMPKVLFLHLKRTEYNVKNRKINSYFSFPSILDISPYLNKKNEHKGSTQYELFGVMVHYGPCATGGHYYSYIKTSKNGDWYKFNDSFVIKTTEEFAISNNFGGENEDAFNNGYNPNRTYSAYMLTYIQKSQIDFIFRNVNFESIPPYLLSYEMKKIEEKKQTFSLFADESFVMGAQKGNLRITKDEAIGHISITSIKKVSHIYEKISKENGLNIDSFDVWTLNENLKLMSLLDRNSSEMIESINAKDLFIFKNDQNQNQQKLNQKILFIYFYYKTTIFPLRYLFSIAIDQTHNFDVILNKLFTVIDIRKKKIDVNDLECYEYSSATKGEPIQLFKFANLSFSKILNGISYIFQYRGEKDLSKAPIFKPIQINMSTDIYLIENVHHEPISSVNKFYKEISLKSVLGFADNFNFSANYNLICPSQFSIIYLLELISKISNTKKYQLFAKRISKPIHTKDFKTIEQLYDYVIQNNGFHAPLLYISKALESGVVPLNIIVSYDAVHPDYFERIFVIQSKTVLFADVMKMLKNKIDAKFTDQEIRVVSIKNKRINFICNIEKKCLFDADWIRFEIVPINQRYKFTPDLQKLCQCRFVGELDNIQELPFLFVADNTDTFDIFVIKLKQTVLIDKNSEVYFIKNKKQLKINNDEIIFDYIDINTIILIRI